MLRFDLKTDQKCYLLPDRIGEDQVYFVVYIPNRHRILETYRRYMESGMGIKADTSATRSSLHRLNASGFKQNHKGQLKLGVYIDFQAFSPILWMIIVFWGQCVLILFIELYKAHLSIVKKLWEILRSHGKGCRFWRSANTIVDCFKEAKSNCECEPDDIRNGKISINDMQLESVEDSGEMQNVISKIQSDPIDIVGSDVIIQKHNEMDDMQKLIFELREDLEADVGSESALRKLMVDINQGIENVQTQLESFRSEKIRLEDEINNI